MLRKSLANSQNTASLSGELSLLTTYHTENPHVLLYHAVWGLWHTQHTEPLVLLGGSPHATGNSGKQHTEGRAVLNKLVRHYS